jgi:hypothetical protein
MKKLVFLAIAALAPLLIVSTARGGKGKNEEVTVRWDIVHFTSFNPNTFEAGGHASARAEDLSKITLTGTGTFNPGASDEVTGGGTWQTFSPSGTSTGNGTYKVTGFIRFDQAPGSIPSPPVIDNIGNATNAHSGLVFLSIRYSDGSRGVLIVSCDLPVGTPAGIFEGVTVSKDFVDYWNHEEPVPGIDGNRTAFHVTGGSD